MGGTNVRCEAILQVGDKTETISDNELSRYADEVGLNRIANDRYSRVFALDLLLHERFRGVEAWAIVDDIKALEQGRFDVRTKPAAQFRRAPLRGFWHKHYFSARFVAQNIINQLAGGRGEAVVRATLGAILQGPSTEQMETQLAHRLTIEPMEEREAAGRLTGEWIIFVKHAGLNYYLCLANHESGDQAIYDRIKSTCFPQFPFLAENHDQ